MASKDSNCVNSVNWAVGNFAHDRESRVAGGCNSIHEICPGRIRPIPAAHHKSLKILVGSIQIPASQPFFHKIRATAQFNRAAADFFTAHGAARIRINHDKIRLAVDVTN